MENDTNTQNVEHTGADEPQQGPMVTITIDNTDYEVRRGRETVTSLKHLAGISQSYELDEVEDGRLVPLADNASITIKGGEDFKSNLKVGQSS